MKKEEQHAALKEAAPFLRDLARTFKLNIGEVRVQLYKEGEPAGSTTIANALRIADR
jgi:hypothetical protein